MRNVIHPIVLLAALYLPGCAAVTAVSAVPGVLFEAVGSQFGKEEESFPRNIEPTAAAVQRSLHGMRLDADVLEIQETGYGIAFGNAKLKGTIKLEKMTPELTTMRVRVHSKVREASVERAIIDSVRTRLAHTGSRHHFTLKGFRKLRARADEDTARLGWYRKNAELVDARRNGKTDWLRLKLPSGKMGYLKSPSLAVASQ